MEDIKRIKLLSIGDTQVGKSCVIKRFCEGTCPTDNQTIGVDYGVKTYMHNNEESINVYLFSQDQFLGCCWSR